MVRFIARYLVIGTIVTGYDFVASNDRWKEDMRSGTDREQQITMLAHLLAWPYVLGREIGCQIHPDRCLGDWS